MSLYSHASRDTWADGAHVLERHASCQVAHQLPAKLEIWTLGAATNVALNTIRHSQHA